MMKIRFFGTSLADECLTNGIEALAPHYDFIPVFEEENADIMLTVCRGEKDKLSVHFADGKAEIAFDKKNQFFRGLSLLLQELQAGKTTADICENVQFNMCGAMFDVSQGSAVINIPTMKRFIRNMAMMGINTLMMYCEDSFDVPEEPYFGYMRARYSETDMRTLDDYADMFGIEMIPCIQTLGHLSEVLKWSNVYGNITRDEAWALLNEYNKEEFHIEHSLIVEGTMKYFAKELGHDEEFWGLVGLLHDLDFEKYPDQHCIKTEEILREKNVSEELIHAVVSHGYGITVDVKPEHEMEKVLFAVDELTGLIGAVAIMRPSKSVQDLELKSVKKKFKTPKFAAGCSREVIEQGAEMLGWSLDELIERTINALRTFRP